MWYRPKGSMPRCRYNVPFTPERSMICIVITHLRVICIWIYSDLHLFHEIYNRRSYEALPKVLLPSITSRAPIFPRICLLYVPLSAVTLWSLFFLYIMPKETDTTYVIQSPEKFSERQVKGLVRTGLQARQQQEKTRSSFSVEKPSAQQYKNIASDSHRAYFLIKTPQHSSTSSSPSSQILHSESASPRSVDDREGGFLMEDHENRLSNQDIEYVMLKTRAFQRERTP